MAFNIEKKIVGLLVHTLIIFNVAHESKILSKIPKFFKTVLCAVFVIYEVG
jgi:hypothetical protein